MDEQTLLKKHILGERQRRGARVLYWIAGLSLINTCLILSKSTLVMVAGLGITEIADTIAVMRPGLGPVAMGVDVAALVFFLAMGRLAVKGQDWALWVGMIMYVLDGVLLLFCRDFIGGAFHGLLLRSAWVGLSASHQLRTMARAEAAAARATA